MGKLTDIPPRVTQLLDDCNDDSFQESDIPLIKRGVLHLNWTDRPEGRCHPFVTVSPLAAKAAGTAGKFLNDPQLYNELLESARQLNQTLSDVQTTIRQWREGGVPWKLR